MQANVDEVEKLRNVLATLRKPIGDLSDLLPLLSAPLAFFGVLPQKYKKYTSQPIATKPSASSVRLIPSFQETLLQNVVPTWATGLEAEGLSDLLEGYYNASGDSGGLGGLFVVYGVGALLGGLPHVTTFSVRLLEKVFKRHQVDGAFLSAFDSDTGVSGDRATVLWLDYLQAVFAVPGKVANSIKDADYVPEALQYNTYFRHILVSVEVLLFRSTSRRPTADAQKEAVSQLILKLVNTGFFPPSTPLDPTPSFFQTNLHTMRRRLERNAPQYSEWLAQLWSSLSMISSQKVLSSLLGTMEWSNLLQTSDRGRRKIQRSGRFLRNIYGSLSEEETERWDVVTGVIIGKSWPEDLAQVMVCWVSCDGSLEELLDRVMKMWTNQQYIKFSMLSRHRYLTAMLVLTVGQLPSTSSAVSKLSRSPAFLESIALYIGHADASIRRCGMLVAEVVARKLGQNLDFGDWTEPGQGRDWCQTLRQLAEETSVDDATGSDSDEDEDSRPTIEEPEAPESTHPSTSKHPLVDSDDDSLIGYGSASVSSRSASPTPSELDEIEKDPSLSIGKRKIPKPVYLIQLADLLTPGKGQDDTEPDRAEMALNEGAALIRRKRGYGLELEENAVNLVFAFVRLQDNFDLDGFSDKRQDALNALVACCPEKSAPCIIEQFFVGQYSVDVRSAILSALVMGARELAGLATPPGPSRSLFPSKMLPEALHKKYIAPDDIPHDQPILRIMDDISSQAISRTRDATEHKAPQLVREKQLRVRQRPIAELRNTSKPSQTTFNDLAAEYFVMPLINRFWVHLRDEQTREERTRHSKSRYTSDGTGRILSPVLLGQLLLTLAILLHASRNSSAFLNVLGPEALEIALTMGTRPVGADKEATASVLASALELVFVVLDSSWELDSGRTLAFDHIRLLVAAKEWVTKVFDALEGGAMVEDGGGDGDARVRRASAGVLLILDEIMTKWKATISQL